jgi:hypothetical protein
MTVTEGTWAGTGRCDHCAFWKITRPPLEGFCLRNAPRPCSASDGIAHWPTTHGRQGCGEFTATGSHPKRVACGDCAFWHRPELGLQPVDRGDKPASWWNQAGLCIRHAPRPVSDPGPRAFWCATHQADSCADGRHAMAQDAT